MRTPLGRRRWIRASALVLLGLTVAAVSLALPISGAAAGSGRERTVHITLKQWGYDPGIIQVNQGDKVTLVLSSADVVHGFYLDGYGLQRTVEPGEDQTVSFVADRPGRWTFRCSSTCGAFHPYMTGWLEVSPNRFAGGGTTLAFAIGIGAMAMLGWEVVRS